MAALASRYRMAGIMVDGEAGALVGMGTSVENQLTPTESHLRSTRILEESEMRYRFHSFSTAYATTVSPVPPAFSSSSSSNSCGTGISHAAISSSLAPTKQSSQQPSAAPVPILTGGPKTRQVIGRHAYTSQSPVAGFSAGQGASFANSSNRSSSSSDVPSTPVRGSPGNSGAYSAIQALARCSIASAVRGSAACSSRIPAFNRTASSALMANAP